MANEGSVDARTAEELLRRFEPVIRFTKGEWFYPMDSEPYVDACSLWVARPNEDAVCVSDGHLTLVCSALVDSYTESNSDVHPHADVDAIPERDVHGEPDTDCHSK